MPVYRGKRKISVIPHIPLGGVRHSHFSAARSERYKVKPGEIHAHTRIIYEGGKRVLVRHGGWGFRKTSLKEINQRLSLTPTWKIESIIDRKIKEKGKKITVLYWGSGEGKPLEEIQAKFDLPQSSVIGYSDVQYLSMEKSQEKITHIVATKEDLPNYFKRKPIDVIFAHASLVHVPTRPLYRHLLRLSKVMAPGCILVTDNGIGYPNEHPDLERIFNRMGFHILAESGKGIVVQKP